MSAGTSPTPDTAPQVPWGTTWPTLDGFRDLARDRRVGAGVGPERAGPGAPGGATTDRPGAPRRPGGDPGARRGWVSVPGGGRGGGGGGGPVCSRTT